MKNRQKGKNMTKPIEAESLTGSQKIPNESSLQKENTKTTGFKTCFPWEALFTDRIVADKQQKGWILHPPFFSPLKSALI